MMPREPEPSIDILFSEEQIASRVENLANEIVSDSADIEAELLVVVILKGSFVFAADLIRALDRAGGSPRVDFITLSSYGAGTKSKGSVSLTHDLVEDVAGRSLLIVDDVLESGRTLAFANETMQSRGAARVRTCLLLDKPEKRKMDIEADYVGFSIGDKFVVGYGLDLAHRYRGLPYIGAINGD
jgi:hypoxanthine phosphoribosyltransferase